MVVGTIDFFLLGPLEARQRERPLRLGSIKHRMLLAKLLLHANQVVSTDELIEAVWGEEPPPTVKQSLQNHVAALRKAIEAGNGAGPPRTLVTRDPGYLLRVDPERLDLHRFQRLDHEGRQALAAGDPARAAEMGLPADAQPFVVPGADGTPSAVDSDIPDWLGNLTPTVQVTEEPQYAQTYTPFNTADFALPGPNAAPPTTMVSDLPDGMGGATGHFAEAGLHHTDPTLDGQAAPQGQFFDGGASDLGPMGPYTELQMPAPEQLPGGAGASHDMETHGSTPSEQPWYLRSSTGNMPPMPDADPMSSSRLGQMAVDESGGKRVGAMVECPNCRESVPDTSLACPSCRYSFFVNCPFCHELVDTSDAKPGVMEPCPYCQNEISKMDMGLGTVNESASRSDGAPSGNRLSNSPTSPAASKTARSTAAG